MNFPYLLTPGPLSVSETTHKAMLRDWGSREPDFIAMNGRIRARLLALAQGGKEHICIPIQGSGTFAVEAAIQTLVARDATLLVLINGAYGRRMVDIARRAGRNVVTVEYAENEAVNPLDFSARLAQHPETDMVAVVHCETTAGVLNPIEAIAGVAKRNGKGLLIDAMSSFGAIPIDARKVAYTALMSASGKCLEGVPGMSFVIAEKAALERSAGNSLSISLDLHAQWQGFEKDGQWRFTPPTHVLAALDAALAQHEAEGGIPARQARYVKNCETLLVRMKALGFQSVVAPEIQAPIITSYDRPPALNYESFRERLRQRGFVVYPGKLTKRDTFRIGCIGAIDARVIHEAVDAIAAVLAELGIKTPLAA